MVRNFLESYAPTALLTLVVLLVAWWVGGYLAGHVEKACLKARMDLTLARFLSKACRWSAWVLAGILILQQWGVAPNSLSALLGSLGFALAFGLQASLSHLAAGILLLVLRPFNVGDFVVIGSSEGTVEALDLFSTYLNTADNRHLILPNSKVFGGVIKNYFHNPTRRADVPVVVAFSADTAQTRQVLLLAAQNLKATFPGAPDQPVSVYLMELGPRGVLWSVRMWSTPANFGKVREQLVQACKAALDAHGIAMAGPQARAQVKIAQVLG